MERSAIRDRRPRITLALHAGYSFSIFGITSARNNSNERSASLSVMAPKNRYDRR
jgi:hypothetical protein